jgi:hypothetical protein
MTSHCALPVLNMFDRSKFQVPAPHFSIPVNDDRLTLSEQMFLWTGCPSGGYYPQNVTLNL